jgi:hypothetical protein
MWRHRLPQAAAAFGAASYATVGLVRAKQSEVPASSPVRGLRNADALLMADAELETPPRRFERKTILITGAGGSFGRAGALYFASEGANVIAADMGQAALEETRRTVLEAQPSARFVTAVCDVRDRASVRALVEAGIAAFGAIDLCWNNAGVQGQMMPTLEYLADDFQLVPAPHGLKQNPFHSKRAGAVPWGAYDARPPQPPRRGGRGSRTERAPAPSTGTCFLRH